MFVPVSDTAIKVYEQKNAIGKDATLGSYYISPEKFEELKGFEVFPEDIIVSCAGTIGETFVMPTNIHRGIINQALMRIMLYEKELADFYLLYFDFVLKADAQKYAKGTAIKNIPPFDVLKQFLIPIPPLAEQKRIILYIKNFEKHLTNIDDSKTDIQTLVATAKQKILSLAIRGKLVPQDPNDAPASVLLERIRAEREALIKAGKIKRGKGDSADVNCRDNSYYSELPDSWRWCKLSDIVQIINGDRGKNYPSKEKLSKIGIPFVSASNISNGKVVEDELLCMTETQYNLLGNGKLQYNDIVFCIRGSLGKMGIFKFEKGAIASSLVIVRIILESDILRKYVFNYLSSELIYDEISKYDNGTAQPNLAAKDFSNFLLPLPPIAEQQRIVTATEAAFEQLDAITATLT